MRKALGGLIGVLLLANVTPAAAQGAAWVPTYPVKPYGPYSVAAFIEGVAYVAQQDFMGRAQILKSTDYGVTWTEMPPLPDGGGLLVDFLTPDKGFATRKDRLYKTTDGARSWSKVQSPWEKPADIDFLDAASDGKSIVAGVRVARTSDGEPWGWEPGSCPDSREDRLEIFVSRDLGTTWRRSVLVEYPVQADAADFADHRHGAINVSAPIDWEKSGACGYRAEVITGRQILITNDAGRTVSHARRCPEGDSCLAVDRSSARHLVVGTTSGAISTSFDGGKTFLDGRLDGLVETPLLYDDYRWVEDIAFANDRVGYALTNGRGLWRTADGGRTWTREPSPLDVPGNQRLHPARIATAGAHNTVGVGPTAVVTRLP